MIPVALQTEPADFDLQVRQKGYAWLRRKGMALDSPPPKGSRLPAYWSGSNHHLWEKYEGICAYLAIFFEWSTGASSTDHFVAKSKHAGDAYEWKNYRLSCLGANRNKNKYDDVLDPVGLQPETFLLNLLDGKIRANKTLSAVERLQAIKTIARLKLNDPEMKKMRSRHYGEYLSHRCESFFKEKSPFVWYEARRQNLL